jgi:hypothetical protein
MNKYLDSRNECSGLFVNQQSVDELELIAAAYEAKAYRYRSAASLLRLGISQGNGDSEQFNSVETKMEMSQWES